MKSVYGMLQFDSRVHTELHLKNYRMLLQTESLKK